MSSIACWVAFDMACPKHDPTIWHASWKAKQETIKVNAKVKMLKLDPSSLIYAIILSSKLKGV